MSYQLNQRLADELAQLIADDDIEAGTPLRTQKLADRFNVSRTPIRAALKLLEARNIVEKRLNRGYVVGPRYDAMNGDWESEADVDTLPKQYYALADDWLNDCIKEEVTESYLRERYDLPKIRMLEIMRAAESEGWAERKKGYGWRFLPVAKSPEALDQIYRVRAAIEPAAILDPGFICDGAVLRNLRAMQEAMLSGLIDTLSKEKLVAASTQFHEDIIRMSNNPFFVQSLRRLNRIRRLLQYRKVRERETFYITFPEHLEILRSLESGDRLIAAELMRKHLRAPSSRDFDGA